MQLHQSTWRDVESYLTKSTGIIVPIGSTEQHGPTGLLGTDALCPEAIAREAGERGGILVAPTFNVGIAAHHMGFAGTMTLRPSTMIAALQDWVNSLAHHGFDRIYFLNGHGGNIATIQAAFAEIYDGQTFARGSNQKVKCQLRNWWTLPQVEKLRDQLYAGAEGSHATPSEVAVTYFLHPEKADNRPLEPRIAPTGGFTNAETYRARFPDGRIGSDPSLATPADGGRFIDLAATDVVADFRAFLRD